MDQFEVLNKEQYFNKHNSIKKTGEGTLRHYTVERFDLRKGSERMISNRHVMSHSGSTPMTTKITKSGGGEFKSIHKSFQIQTSLLDL